MPEMMVCADSSSWCTRKVGSSFVNRFSAFEKFASAARSFGATRLRIWLSIYLPAMAPHVITGLRVGMIFNIIGILLAEMYASQSGLGMLLLRWSESYEVNQLMAATIFISVVTILINEAMRLWEAGVGRWQSARMAE